MEKGGKEVRRCLSLNQAGHGAKISETSGAGGAGGGGNHLLLVTEGRREREVQDVPSLWMMAAALCGFTLPVFACPSFGADSRASRPHV